MSYCLEGVSVRISISLTLRNWYSYSNRYESVKELVSTNCISYNVVEGATHIINWIITCYLLLALIYQGLTQDAIRLQIFTFWCFCVLHKIILTIKCSNIYMQSLSSKVVFLIFYKQSTSSAFHLCKLFMRILDIPVPGPEGSFIYNTNPQKYISFSYPRMEETITGF